MNEKKGRKVQNRHRPLAPRQLGRWFRRHRYDATPDEDYDASFRDDDYSRVEAPDLHDLELKQLLRDIVHQPPPPLFRREWVLDAAMRSEDELAPSPQPGQPAERLEERLASFTQGIRQFPNSPATRRGITDAIGDDVCRDVMKSAEKPCNGRHLVENLCLFAPFWIRSPRTWAGGKTSLVDHLFVRYEVPRFLYPEWSGAPGFPRLKWLCWFILFSQGGSLRRAAGPFHWNIVGRFEHYLRTASPGASPQEACAFAQIMRLGGAPLDCRRILNNPAFAVDTTIAAERDASSEFWEATVRWVIAHSTAITDEQCERILSWAMHEYTEGELDRKRPFSWKGRGLRSVLQRSLEYQRQLERPWSGLVWGRHGWDWTPIDPALEGWSFVELTSGEELFREGQAMRHCVSSYARACAAGNSAIVSLRFNETRRITVEIDPATGRVVQARGACNRPASNEEDRVIRLGVDSVVRPSLP